MTMQRVVRLVVVAGLAMRPPTAVCDNNFRTGSMKDVSCGSDGRTIETNGRGCHEHQEGFSGISAASNFLNTYVKIHSGDTSKPFSCADGLIYVDSSKRYSAITTLGVTHLSFQKDDGESTDVLYYLKSGLGRCADVVAALKALSHDTTTPRPPKTTKTTTTTITTTTTPTKITATSIPQQDDDVDEATDFSGLRVDCASGTCALVDVCNHEIPGHSETTFVLQKIFGKASFKCGGGKIYYTEGKVRFLADLQYLDDRATKIGCAPFTQKDHIGFEVSAGDDPGRLIFPAEFENNAAACETMRNNLVSVLTSYATGTDDNSGCKVAVTSTTVTRTTTTRTTTTRAKTTTTTTAAAALTPSLETMMCDMTQPFSRGGYLQAASCNTQGASDETQFFNEFLKRNGKAGQPFKCLTKATIKKMKFSGYNEKYENDIYVDIGGDTHDRASGPGRCADLISPIKAAALALCDADPSCSQSHVNTWMICVHLHSDMYRITTRYHQGCSDMKEELQLLSLPGTSTSTTTAVTATTPDPTPASTTASSTTPNSNTDASTTAETDDGSSTLSPPLATTATATANPAISPESTALAPATTTPQPVAASSSGGNATVTTVLIVLILLAAAAAVAVWWFKFRDRDGQQARYQHGQADAVHNPVFPANLPNLADAVYAAMPNGSDGDGDGDDANSLLYDRITGDDDDDDYGDCSERSDYDKGNGGSGVKIPFLTLLRDAIRSEAMQSSVPAPADDVERLKQAVKRAAETSGNTPEHTAVIVRAVNAALRFGVRVHKKQRRAKTLPAQMTATDISAIYMYTLDTELYKAVNKALRYFGEHTKDAEGLDHIRPFLPFIKLLLDAVEKVPRSKCEVFRGVRSAVATLIGNKTGGDRVVFDGFTSTSLSADVLRLKDFLGMGAGLGERTVFRIAVVNGRNVSAYSANGPNASLVATGAPANEFEVMLLPGTAMLLKAVTECPHDVTEVSAVEADNGAEGSHEAVERCPKCNTKIQFCTCNVRRNTRDMRKGSVLKSRQCTQTTRAGPCTNLAVINSVLCGLHTCGTIQCRASKRSSAAFCAKCEKKRAVQKEQQPAGAAGAQQAGLYEEAVAKQIGLYDTAMVPGAAAHSVGGGASLYQVLDPLEDESDASLYQVPDPLQEESEM